MSVIGIGSVATPVIEDPCDFVAMFTWTLTFSDFYENLKTSQMSSTSMSVFIILDQYPGILL
jgi:hypothetical protein